MDAFPGHNPYLDFNAHLSNTITAKSNAAAAPHGGTLPFAACIIFAIYNPYTRAEVNKSEDDIHDIFIILVLIFLLPVSTIFSVPW